MLAQMAEQRGTVAPEPRPGRGRRRAQGRRAWSFFLDEEWYADPDPLGIPGALGDSPPQVRHEVHVDEDGEVEMGPELELWYPQGPRGPLQTGDSFRGIRERRLLWWIIWCSLR